MWASILFFLCLYWKSIASLDVFLSGSSPSNTKNSLTLKDIKRFTRYSLSFQSLRNENVDLSSEAICPAGQSVNSTAIMLEQMIDRCANSKFYPRHLSPKQVSWKKSTKSTKRSDNQTQSSAVADKDSQESGDEIVSEYLAFTLLLPDHPFSSDLYYAVAAIAPMFPRVTFVLGMNHENVTLV